MQITDDYLFVLKKEARFLWENIDYNFSIQATKFIFQIEFLEIGELMSLRKVKFNKDEWE